MKFALVVGHTIEAPGAKAVAPINQHEYYFNKAVAEKAVLHAKTQGVECRIFLRDAGGLKGAYMQLNRWKPDACVELHFNAANQKATGTCTLYGKSNPRNSSLASDVQKALCTLYSRDKKTDRGTKLLTAVDRGYANVHYAECPSVLIEPFFGDAESDAKIGFEKQDELSVAIIQCLINFCKNGVTKNGGSER